MTSVERARRFIQARGKAIAITIVPLAAIAIAATQPARAANVLVFGSGGCNVAQTGVLAGPTLDCSATPIPGFQNNANGVKLTGSGSVSIVSGGYGAMTFELSGLANGGEPDGALPVSWDFTVGLHQQVASVQGSGSLYYYLTYRLNSGSGSFSKSESGDLVFDTGCGDLTCAHVTGTDILGVDGPVSSYDISLIIGGYFNPYSFLQVTIPGDSVDLNPQAAQVSGTPEPASMALGLSGLLGLAFARFRRRKA